MNRSNHKAFATAINNAGLSRKTALQLEVAVTFAVHLDSKQAKRLTRAVMCEIFSDCGYKSSAPGDRDWREINRRITAGIALFDYLSQGEDIAAWVEGKARMEIINAIVARLEPLDLRSTNQILEICEKVKTRQRGPRAEPEGTHKIESEHLKIVIPPDVTRAELVSAAIEMMRLAEQMVVAQEAEQAAATNGNGHAQHETVDEEEEATV